MALLPIIQTGSKESIMMVCVMKKVNSLLFAISLLLQSSAVFADKISVEASVDRKIVPIGGTVRLTVSINGTQSAVQPTLPDIQGFQTHYVGPSTKISVVNGKMSASVSQVYSLVALKVGKYTISSISVTHEGKKYQTAPINVEIIKGNANSNSGSRKEILEDLIYLTLTAAKDTVYLNQELPITITLYSRQVNVRDIEYPTFTTTAFSIKEFEKPTQRRENIDGVLFNVVQFQTIVNPVSVGPSTLGPAELKCSLVVGNRARRHGSLFDDDFFARPQRRPIVLKSDSIVVTVLDFPTQRKPHGFNGTVGEYELHVDVKPTSVKVGEPITLTMTVTGRGNIETILTPFITNLNGFKAYDAQATTTSRGKTFEQVLIPKDASLQAIPEIQFSFFQPASAKYQTLRKGPFPISVAANAIGDELKIVDIPQAALTARRTEELGRDILYIKDSIGSVHKGNAYLYRSGLFLFAQLLPLAAYFGILGYRKRKDRLKADVSYARLRRAPRKAKEGMELASKLMKEGKSAEFCDTVFKVIQEYLGDSFNLPTAGLTSEVLDELEGRGIEAEILENLSEFFELCDGVRYAPAQISRQEMQSLFQLTENTMKRISEQIG